MIPRCLTIAGSDSGGGAGIQADLKAFARLGCHGTSAIVALTAQNTVAVRSIHEVPPAFVVEQLAAVFDDIGVDAAKTGMLFSARIIEAVAGYIEECPVPLVVDPVMIATSGARLLEDDAVDTLIGRLIPLATVITPNLHEACALAGVRHADDVDRGHLAEALVDLGVPAVVITGGDGLWSADWLYDGEQHTEIAVQRYPQAAAHGSGCTHSATLCALLAGGAPLVEAARQAAELSARAVRDGLADLGSGAGPVDVFGLAHR